MPAGWENVLKSSAKAMDAARSSPLASLGPLPHSLFDMRMVRSLASWVTSIPSCCPRTRKRKVGTRRALEYRRLTVVEKSTLTDHCRPNQDQYQCHLDSCLIQIYLYTLTSSGRLRGAAIREQRRDRTKWLGASYELFILHPNLLCAASSLASCAELSASTLIRI